MPSVRHRLNMHRQAVACGVLLCLSASACGGDPVQEELLDPTQLIALMDDQVVLFAGQSNAAAEIHTPASGERAQVYNEAGLRTWVNGWEPADAGIGGQDPPGVGLLIGSFAWLLESRYDVHIDAIGEPWLGAHIGLLGPTTDNYQTMRDRVQASQSEPKVMLWHQGESDGVNGTTEADYRAALETLIDAWRSDYPSLEYVVMYQTLPNACAGDQNQVRAAQTAVAAADPGVLLVNTDALGDSDSYVDGCHFDWDGYEQHAHEALKSLSLTTP